MVWIVLLAVGLGWALQIVRSDRTLRTDEAIFTSCIAESGKLNASLKSFGPSVHSRSNFFELSRRCDYVFQTPTGKPISIKAELRYGPFLSVREVIIEASGRAVTWPLEDIERGRKIELRAEFPEAFH